MELCYNVTRSVSNFHIQDVKRKQPMACLYLFVLLMNFVLVFHSLSTFYFNYWIQCFYHIRYVTSQVFLESIHSLASIHHYFNHEVKMLHVGTAIYFSGL